MFEGTGEDADVETDETRRRAEALRQKEERTLVVQFVAAELEGGTLELGFDEGP